MPSLKSKMEYLEAVYQRYHKADKDEKKTILDEFCRICKYNRKYAIRKLNGDPPATDRIPRRRQRGFLYSRECLHMAEIIWKASGHLCGQRLKEALPLWLPALKKRFSVSAQVEQELLGISARQLDERLRVKKRTLKKRIYCTTRPGSILKSMIPIRTSNWDIRQPGFVEIDLVAHCGNSNEGQFIFSLDTTDIQTGWTERRAVMGKGQTGVLDKIREIRDALPFRLRGIDSDNGEEFINWQLLRYCQAQRPRVDFTRGRANRKNDNAYIEQKNWTHVRQIFGWNRYETEDALALMNDLYSNELRTFQNLFQPSMKLQEKKHVGSKTVRTYDTPKTPLQRVLASGKYHRAKMKKLRLLQASLDPFLLSQSIDRKIARLIPLASQRISLNKAGLRAGPLARIGSHSSQQHRPKRRSPWRDFSFSRNNARLKKRLRQIEMKAGIKNQIPPKGGSASVTF